MSMKKSDLARQLALKIDARMRTAGAPDRYGQSAATASERRERRQRDVAAGLVPFACKLPADLTQRIVGQAASHPAGINALVADLLEAGLAAGASSTADSMGTT